MASETKSNSTVYTQKHRSMVKDIIIAYDTFFSENLNDLDTEKCKTFMFERLEPKQRKYIEKIVKEAYP